MSVFGTDVRHAAEKIERGLTLIANAVNAHAQAIVKAAEIRADAAKESK